jgi:3-oxoacyl-[acyl-carrier-protein] synthase-3
VPPLPSRVLVREQAMKAMIRAVGAYAPARVMTNQEMSTIVDTSDEWIREKTGVRSRHIAASDEATSDLAIRAARVALERAGVPAEAVDLILLATSTPDYPSFPSTACIVQDRIGARNAGAMDIVAACTGFIYALDTASAFIKSKKARNVLVIGAEVMSRVLDWTDRSTCVLFGDAAGAVIIERTDAPSEGPGKRGLIRSILGSDGSGYKELICERGGTRKPFKRGETVETPTHMDMNGRAVYNFAVKAFTDTLERLLEEEGITMDDVAKIIPHQANMRIIQAAAKRLKVSEDKFFMNIEKYANTSNATIPVALDEFARSGNLKKGDLIMTVGFGAGLTYGGNLIVW